jgi:DNA-binding transcriptional LysR family regulator
MSWDPRVGRRLKLRDLHILMEVVKAGSMGKAADRLNVSQPVVSKAVATLERALGVRLLDRSVRGIELTEYGRAALKCGVAVFDDIKKGIEEIEYIADPTVGLVRVGCSDPEFVGIVTDVIERLSARHPCIAFDVVRTDATAPYRDLEAREVDFLMTTLFGHLNSDHLDVEVLYNEPIVVAVGLQSQWASRRRVDLSELVGEPWLLAPAGGFATAVLIDAFRARGLSPPKPVVVCSSERRLALLTSGRFITSVPGIMLQSAARRLSIKALPVRLSNQHRPVGIVTLKGRSLSPVAELFIECAREVAKPLARDKRRSVRGRSSTDSPHAS